MVATRHKTKKKTIDEEDLKVKLS